MDILEVVETTVMSDSLQMILSGMVIFSVILLALGAIVGMIFDAQEFGMMLMILSVVVGFGITIYTETLDTENQYKTFVSDEKVVEEQGYRIVKHIEEDIYLLEKEK